jgi:hypothetical protein
MPSARPMAVPTSEAMNPASHTNKKSLTRQRWDGGADSGGKFTGKKSNQYFVLCTLYFVLSLTT